MNTPALLYTLTSLLLLLLPTTNQFTIQKDFNITVKSYNYSQYKVSVQHSNINNVQTSPGL